MNWRPLSKQASILHCIVLCLCDVKSNVWTCSISVRCTPKCALSLCEFLEWTLPCVLPSTAALLRRTLHQFSCNFICPCVVSTCCAVCFLLYSTAVASSASTERIFSTYFWPCSDQVKEQAGKWKGGQAGFALQVF